jgi:hypothetical protein
MLPLQPIASSQPLTVPSQAVPRGFNSLRYFLNSRDTSRYRRYLRRAFPADGESAKSPAVMQRLHSWSVLLTYLLLALATIPALAQGSRADPNGFTWGELSILPEYCRDTQGVLYGGPGSGLEMSPRAAQWVALMGDDFWHMHHYCYALRNLIRVEDPNLAAQHKRSLLERTVGEFRYIINNCRAAMPLMPEVFLRMGEVQLRLGRIGEALASFEQSRRLKVDYWPAYTRWIDVLLDSKQFDSAAALARDGLKHLPEHPELVKRLEAAEKRMPRPGPTK